MFVRDGTSFSCITRRLIIFQARFSKTHILNLLPTVHCCTPLEFLNQTHEDGIVEWLGMDRKEFESETFQRPFQYLSRYQQGLDLNDFSFTAVEG